MLIVPQLGTPGCDLNKNLGLDTASWAVTSEGTIQTNGHEESKLEKKIQEGDVIVSEHYHKRNRVF